MQARFNPNEIGITPDRVLNWIWSVKARHRVPILLEGRDVFRGGTKKERKGKVHILVCDPGLPSLVLGFFRTVPAGTTQQEQEITTKWAKWTRWTKWTRWMKWTSRCGW